MISDPLFFGFAEAVSVAAPVEHNYCPRPDGYPKICILKLPLVAAVKNLKDDLHWHSSTFWTFGTSPINQ